MQPAATGLDHVVVIGASAGGLEAIQELLAHLPAGGHATYVVAQHLSPDHPSQLVDLLKRSTGLEVISAADQQPLGVDRVMVLPPNCDAIFTEEGLSLAEPEPRYGPSPSIDRLFDSLAHHWGHRSVAIVLSGTGSDGACGLRTVGAAGGLTLVQSPASARFDGMPSAAIALGGVDLIAGPAELGAQLCRWFSAGMDWAEGEPAESTPLLLSSAAAQLKQCTGVDFSQYKESTLRRQVQRRMAVRGIHSMEEYLSTLAHDGEEGQALLRNLLVTVTTFFRNPEAFSALKRHLKPLIEKRPADQRLRIWVPACATGEEAYSIGMIVSESMGHPIDLSQRLKIFATDLDEQSLAIGRRGRYPIAAGKTIPADLRERFTKPVDDSFEISKELRNSIVFARHNVSEDPPFPGIDLISCRNALIYFTTPLQERVIDLFGFSLHSGGLLFLGSSESLGRTSGFSAVNPIHRIYERDQQERRSFRHVMAKPIAASPSLKRSAQPPAIVRESVPEQHVKLLEGLIRTLVAPSLIVDENHDLIEVVGNVSPYCKVPEGRLTSAAGAFLRNELQSEAKALLLLVRADRTIARSGSLRLEGLGNPLHLQASPLEIGEHLFTILSFIEDSDNSIADLSELGRSDRDAAFAREIERLERELLSSQNSLRRSMADLEQANEELEASTEELQASSEELQSSNEELEASNEELQATNEELGGLNQQLRSRSEELEQLNNDLENIQGSLSQGMVIVDRQLRITRFSPLAVRVFGLVESDIGQPLIGIPTTLPISGLRDALLAILNGDERRSIEATSEEVSYLAQIMPYRNREGGRLGAIITLTDVSELVALRRAAEASLHEFASLADALDQVVWKRDRTMQRILYVSRRIEALTGWSAQEVCLAPQQLDEAIHPDDRDAVSAARKNPQHGWRVRYRLHCKDGTQRTVEEVATRLDDSSSDGVVGTWADITEDNRLEQTTHRRAQAFQLLAEANGLSLALVDAERQVCFANQAFMAMAGSQDPDHLTAYLGELRISPLAEQASTAQPTALMELAQQVLQENRTVRQPLVKLICGEQSLGWFELELHPLDQGNTHAGALVQLRPSPTTPSNDAQTTT